MCGINGIWHLKETVCSEESFIRFTDSLSHRGPDGRGLFYDESERLRLGHRRLKILDLSDAGHQPMPYLNERYWITFNGEIYNFLEIQKELEKEGFKFRSRSDTEVILAAYVYWGESCQLKFNGMWAFAIWDSHKKELFLSRDRFGVKPLHYIYSDHFFAFASEMKAFLALDKFIKAFDEQALSIALRDPSALEATEHCLFKGVKRLQAGYCAIIKANGALSVRKWWNTLDHLQSVPNAFEDQVAYFRELFLDACRLRMRSDVAIGSALSGGLDSSSVLCSLKYLSDQASSDRQARDWQAAFIASYPYTEQDETLYANEVVKHCKVAAHYVDLNPSTMLNYFDEALFSLEDIFEVPIGPWLIYRAFRQANRVISIDGHGADELLGGYHRQIKNHMKKSLGNLPAFFSTAETLRYLYPKHLSPLRFYGDIALKAAKRFVPQKSAFSLKKELWGAVKEDYSHLDAYFDLFNKELYIDFHYRTLPAILRNFDRCSMAHGVEIRAPFLDYRLVCYSFSLPTSAKIGGGYTKRILREAMKDILPESTRKRRSKVGFACPMQEWLTGGLKSFVLDTINSKSFQESPFWPGMRIRDIVQTSYAKSDITTLRDVFDLIVANRLMNIFQQKV